ncbi:MIP/aquaporin family protein [Paenibacillus mucilaginosus]|uniref:GlpF n=2 Tax=Paenibacillus mucilaginosus TaxID=61624 RepID=H6NGM3_9BACL|nr:MIP/aquaporin family protein [Paenibacillus mucilaginosus]AEI46325.1 GlpF [Paenibacillus mucilaginosus KNP414]AFC33926.1 GlpF [Paenibacillus mucilaginosus 3016]MCG7213561.1 aquaporin family protein [Paenibacillus mucilaginosus]WDM27623.1 aquaporin family protein [Paenibacillus mucilaginosus]WFA22303.1 aquaporin family protein [Paenibacillus mucilaginosus]
MVPWLGELIGTMILITLGAGVCAGVSLKKSYANNGGWIVITMGWGMAVAFAVYAVGKVSGAHLNPAVTLALAVKGDFDWALVPVYVIAQLAGAMLGSAIVYLQYLPHWKETEDAGTKLGVFATGPAVDHPFSNLLSEMMGTFIFIVALLALGANTFTEGLNPLLVGFLVVSIGLSLGGTTGYAINPARDFGPRLAHYLLPIAGKGPSNWRYAWIPVAGPLLGGMLGSVFYQAFFEGAMPPLLWYILGACLLALLFTYRMGLRRMSRMPNKAAA